MGVEPVNPSYLGGVFGVLWILTITAFRPRELVGFFFYILFFLFWVPIFTALFVLKLLNKGPRIQPNTPQTRRGEDRPVRFLAVWTVLLGAWLVLFGGTTDRLLILPGIVLSGLILCSLLLRLFSRVRPTIDSRLVRYGWLTGLTQSAMVEHYSKDLDPSEYDIDKLDSEIGIIRSYRKFLLWLARRVRSSRWKNALAMMILAEYGLTLLVVISVAVFFWALIISVAGSEPMPLSEAMSWSFENFIPVNVGSTYNDPAVPYWVLYGPAATSFLIVVMYISFMSSLVRERQRVAYQELANASRIFRNQSAQLKQESSKREVFRDTLKQQELPAEGEPVESPDPQRST